MGYIIMNIVDATIIESQDATRSAFNMYAAIDWFNAHPEYCFRMAQFLSTNNVIILSTHITIFAERKW